LCITSVSINKQYPGIVCIMYYDDYYILKMENQYYNNPRVSNDELIKWWSYEVFSNFSATFLLNNKLLIINRHL